MYSLTYDYPYNRDIAKRLIELDKLKRHNEPDIFIHNLSGGSSGEYNRLVGGSKFRNSEKSFYLKNDLTGEYIQPSNSASYPMLDFNELKEFDNNKSVDIYPYQGGSIKMKPKPSVILNPTDLLVKRKGKKLTKDVKNEPILEGGKRKKGRPRKQVQLENMEGKGAKRFFKKVGKTLKKVGKDVGKEVLDMGKDVAKEMAKTGVKNIIGEVLDEAIPIPFVDDAIKNVLNKKIGKGRPRKSKGVGIYEGGGKPSKSVKPNDGRKKRAEIVRKIMKEKGLSLPQASKYVKENNLY